MATKLKTKWINYCYTLNNWTDEEYEKLKNIPCVYHMLGKEVSSTGTPHIQGFIHFKNERSFNAVRKLMKRWHIDYCRGSLLDNVDYCSKVGKYEEIGVRPNPGKRTDLDDIKDDILNGKKVENILLEKPILYHQYGRTLNKIEDLAMRKKYRTEMTKGIWY